VSPTYERKLPGAQLQQRLGRDDPGVNPAAARCVTDVLRALATVPATTAMRQLAVLDEDRPLWEGADTFQDAMLDLVRRRVARFGPAIRSHLPDFDRRYARLQQRLGALPGGLDTVIHGDLVTGNSCPDTERVGVDSSLFCLPIDLAGEGIAPVVANAVDRAGVAGVSLAVAYHDARDVLPHNPLRRVSYGGAGVCFRPDARRYARYGQTRLRMFRCAMCTGIPTPLACARRVRPCVTTRSR